MRISDIEMVKLV